MTRVHAAAAAGATGLAILAAAAGDPPARLLPDAQLPAPPAVAAVALAERIRARDPLLVLDARDPASFATFSVPTAVHLDADTAERVRADRAVIVYARRDGDAARIAARMRARTLDAAVLEGGVQAWIEEVLEPRLYLDATPADTQAYRRAAEVSRYFGGVPRAGVERPPPRATSDAAADDAIARTQRRGC